MTKCEMTIEYWDFRANFKPCGRPAKYITPKNPITKKTMFVCGIHRNSIDRFHEQIKSAKRCKALKQK